MTALLRRLSTSHPVLFGYLRAQSTTTVLPPRTELRRALPVATAPIIQQSPNGLYKLSITDTGIELLGPQGGVRITDAGIEIGAPNTTRVAIMANNVNVKSGQDMKLEAAATMDIRGGSTMDIRSGATVQITAAAGASLIGSLVTLGCSSNGRPIARVGDVVNTTVGPPVIVQGSPTVLVCAGDGNKCPFLMGCQSKIHPLAFTAACSLRTRQQFTGFRACLNRHVACFPPLRRQRQGHYQSPGRNIGHRGDEIPAADRDHRGNAGPEHGHGDSWRPAEARAGPSDFKRVLAVSPVNGTACASGPGQRQRRAIGGRRSQPPQWETGRPRPGQERQYSFQGHTVGRWPPSPPWRSRTPGASCRGLDPVGVF